MARHKACSKDENGSRIRISNHAENIKIGTSRDRRPRLHSSRIAGCRYRPRRVSRDRRTLVASYIDKQNVGRAVNDMRVLDNRIQNYKMSNDVYPPSLTDVPQGSLFDPWGRPYNYLQIEGNAKATGQERKDKNLVPINSDFDLYSMGADGKTTAPLTAMAVTTVWPPTIS